MIHDTKNVGKPTVLTCRFPTFYGCLLHIYEDVNNSRLIVGFNVSEYRDDAHTVSIAHSALYTAPLKIRDDSKDLVVEYPEQDEGENDEAEQPVITGNDNADDSDDSSDSDEDGDESTGEGTEIEDGDSN
ncbi:hypothetical protein [Lentilactobacillus buchneri]|uniref:hypothetical protein n=1 Tax=Lentilactobacillus buchneri TaxID=1581 RepID=UPI0039ECC47E